MIITIVGGGSTFTPGIVKSIALRKDELEVDEIRLFDIDRERQDKLGVLVKWILEEDLKSGIKLTVTYDEKEAYTDAVLSDILSVSHLHIVLINHRIVQGSVYLDVTEQSLHLLYRHPFVNGHSCQCAPELVRMHFGDIHFAAKHTQTHFHATNRKPGMGI